MQALYERVFAYGDLDSAFGLYTAFPRTHVAGSTTETLADCNLNNACVLAVEEGDSVPDLMSYMQEERDEVSMLEGISVYYTAFWEPPLTLYDFIGGNST